jgi:hypothetical protein
MLLNDVGGLSGEIDIETYKRSLDLFNFRKDKSDERGYA